MGSSLAENDGGPRFGSGVAGAAAVSRRVIREDRDGSISRKDGAGS